MAHLQSYDVHHSWTLNGLCVVGFGAVFGNVFQKPAYHPACKHVPCWFNVIFSRACFPSWLPWNKPTGCCNFSFLHAFLLSKGGPTVLSPLVWALNPHSLYTDLNRSPYFRFLQGNGRAHTGVQGPIGNFREILHSKQCPSSRSLQRYIPSSAEDRANFCK